MGLEQQVAIVNAPKAGYKAMIEFLEQGGAEAVMVDVPMDIVARRRGLRVFPTPRVAIVEGQCLTTIHRVIKEREEGLRPLLKAYLHAISLLKKDNETMRQCVLTGDRIKKDLKVNFDADDPELLEAFITRRTSWLQAKPYPTLAALENAHKKAVRIDSRAENVNPMTVVDMHYVKELDEEGFIDRLYT
jgi:hypothetical protein